MRHDPDLIAAFSQSEKRLIYARPREGGDLVFLPNGAAHEWRQYSKESLRCPIPTCPSPNLTTVARSPRKRDGFTHLGAGNGRHSAESYAHLEAKGRIAAWLRNRYPHCTVIEEEPTTNGERVADVMISDSEGRKMAFEIQFSAITPGAWKERHDSYRKQGIVDVWLFGSTGAHFRRHGREANSVQLNPAHEAVAAEEQPILWFNPFTQQIATAVDVVPVGGGRYFVPATKDHGQLAVYALDSFSLFRTGLWNDQTRQLVANRDELARLDAERLQRIQLRAAEFEEARLQKLRIAEVAWAQSDLRERMLKRFGGTLPEYLQSPIGGKLPVVPAAWQCYLYGRFIQGDRDDRIVSIDDCARALSGTVPGNSEILYSIAAAWLASLEKAGFLTRTSNAPWWVGSDDSKFIIISRERADQRRLAHALRIARPLPSPPTDDEDDFEPFWSRERRRPVRSSSMLGRPRPSPPAAAPAQKSASLLCRRCNVPLDPVLKDDGVHIGCRR